MGVRKVICALDTGDLNEAMAIVERLSPFVGAFKIGHALTMPHGMDTVARLQEKGAARIFLDLKFHDIPNSVALAVREAVKAGVWALTLHIAGGPAMIIAAHEEANQFGEAAAPLLLGVSVLTSLDESFLQRDLAIQRGLEEHMVYLSRMGLENGLDGVVCSAAEIKALRPVMGHEGVIVTPGIRLPDGETHDQKRVGDALQALEDGADYLVIGRALVESPDPEEALRLMGFEVAGNTH